MKRGDKFNYKGHTATVQFVWADDLIQFSFTAENGEVTIVRAILPCDCAAATEGKWADIHSSGCASIAR